jgi:hypothetical protein
MMQNTAQTQEQTTNPCHSFIWSCLASSAESSVGGCTCVVSSSGTYRAKQSSMSRNESHTSCVIVPKVLLAQALRATTYITAASTLCQNRLHISSTTAKNVPHPTEQRPPTRGPYSKRSNGASLYEAQGVPTVSQKQGTLRTLCL